MVSEPLGLLCLCFCCVLVSLCQPVGTAAAAVVAAEVLGEGGRSVWFASSLGSSEPVTAHPQKQPVLACLPASCGAAAAERERALQLEPREIRTASQRQERWGVV